MNKTLLAVLFALIAVTIATLFLPKPGSAQAGSLPTSGEPVLVELFTSQGCSSCPPADRLVASLTDESNLVILSRPVDYWDRLGWKDTFARAENSALQRAYARRGLGGYNGVYTPQTVVNGSLGEVGSDRPALFGQIRVVAQSISAAIRVNRVTGRGYAIGVAGETDDRAELMLVGVKKNGNVNIGRGENRGREITYSNIVIDERRLANWSGGSASHVIMSDDLSIAGADRYALILRVPGGGRVLAAQWLN